MPLMSCMLQVVYVAIFFCSECEYKKIDLAFFFWQYMRGPKNQYFFVLNARTRFCITRARFSGGCMYREKKLHDPTRKKKLTRIDGVFFFSAPISLQNYTTLPLKKITRPYCKKKNT